MSLYDTIWEWKKELQEDKDDSIILHLKDNTTIKIFAKDHISCIDDVIFVFIKGYYYSHQYGIPIESINYITLQKEVEE